MYHLGLLLLVCLIIIAIVFLYSTQFKKNHVLLRGSEVVNEPKNDSIFKNKCRAIIALKNPDDPCPTCRGVSYIKKNITESSSHIIFGKKVPEGTYCVQTNTPACDEHKGILIIDDDDKIDCICKYPEFFGGPACNKQVACSAIDGEIYPLVDESGKQIDPRANIDFYKEKIRCKCGDSIYGFKQVALGKTNCVIDPCLYPVPLREGGLVENECLCTGGLHHSKYWDRYSPCSSCTFSTKAIPGSFAGAETENTFPIPCFTKYNIVDDIKRRYPCVNVDTSGECGTATINTVFGKNILEGSADSLSDIVYS